MQLHKLRGLSSCRGQALVKGLNTSDNSCTGLHSLNTSGHEANIERQDSEPTPLRGWAHPVSSQQVCQDVSLGSLLASAWERVYGRQFLFFNVVDVRRVTGFCAK